MSLTVRFGAASARRSVPFDTRIRAAIRRCIAEEVERLVDMLDALETDPDLESAGDEEPSLWFASMNTFHDPNAATDDREDDAGDDREADDDREPILGWSETIDQSFSISRIGDSACWDEEEG